MLFWRKVVERGVKFEKNWVILKMLNYFKRCFKLFYYVLIELKLKFYFLLLLKWDLWGRLMKRNK